MFNSIGSVVVLLGERVDYSRKMKLCQVVLNHDEQMMVLGFISKLKEGKGEKILAVEDSQRYILGLPCSNGNWEKVDEAIERYQRQIEFAEESH